MKITKPYNQMTDNEFDEQMIFEREMGKLKYTTKQSVHLYEAFEIFEEDLFDLIIDHLSDPRATKTSRAYWEGLLSKFKRFMAKDDDMRVDQAKARPILSVVQSFSDSEVTYRRNNKCILHNDKTASMKLYQETNSYYCFGCHEGGDVIDLVMKKMNLDFVKAVKFLSN